MKNKKAKLMSLGLAAVGLFSGGQNVFASGNYGITYSGGAELQTAVNSALDLSDLKKLIYASKDELQVRVSGDWQTGWRKASSGTDSADNPIYHCVPVHYLKVTGDTTYSDTYIDEIQLNTSGKSTTYGKYIERVGIEEIKLDGFTLDSGKSVAVVAESQSAGIATFGPIYTDSTCTAEQSDIFKVTTKMLEEDGFTGKVFVKTKINLYQNNSGQIGRTFSSDKLYLGLNDIDRAQSYKIENESSKLTANENMFSPDLSKLQPTTENKKNKFVSGGNYIYSDYPPAFNTNESVIYVKIAEADQQAGLEVVFGFGADAGSTTMFYGKMYKVTYKSDSYGEITGINNEDMLSGENPSGTSEEAASHYEYDYWVADKNVTLEDGTEITKGTHMTSEQIKKVVVHEDLEFTVYHKTYTIEYKSDEHGKITGTTEENRNSSEHPGGSTQEAYTDYHFVYWICDKDVELVDGTKIEAGEAMTDEQVEQVKITQDLVFTAIHETKSNTPNTPDTPNTPNTGSLTKDGNNVAPIIGLMVAALASTGFVGYFIRNRKKSIVKLD